MRKVIVSSKCHKDDLCYFEPFEGYLIQFIVNGSGYELGLIERYNGSIESYPIENIKFKYPTEE